MQPENKNDSTTQNQPVSAVQSPQPAPPAGTAITFQSGMYWRKNLWNGSATVPVVLSLKDGMLSMMDREGKMVFSVPTATVNATFTAFGTIMLTCDGVRYAIVGRGSALSAGFSTVQKSAMGRPNHITDMERVGAAGMAAGAVGELVHSTPLAAGSEAVATAALYGAVSKSDKLVTQWLKVFRMAGIASKGERPHEIRIVLIATLVVIVAIFIISGIMGA